MRAENGAEKSKVVWFKLPLSQTMDNERVAVNPQQPASGSEMVLMVTLERVRDLFRAEPWWESVARSLSLTVNISLLRVVQFGWNRVSQLFLALEDEGFFHVIHLNNQHSLMAFKTDRGSDVQQNVFQH